MSKQNPTERLHTLIEQLAAHLYEKKQVLSLALLAALAGESIFLLGPPGVAKSMIARRLKLAFVGAHSFEYLMSRFSTPDELFGPVSITRLKENDTYERIIDGYLPTADVVFLDEIWKAGPAIQNTLLTLLNEKIYRNGKTEVKVPLKGFIAASNELPAVGQGLEALWDRFLIRTLVTGIEDMGFFDQMISCTEEEEPLLPKSLPVTAKEYEQWGKEAQKVGIHYSIFEVIHHLRESLEDYNQRLENDGGGLPAIYVSDRRWKKWVKILRMSAYLNGSDTIHLSDCFLLQYGLWSEVDQMDWVNEAVLKAILKGTEQYLLNVKGVEDDLKELREKLSTHCHLHESADPGLMLVDTYYYQIEGARMRERLLIFASDYQQLDQEGTLFYLHKDKYKANSCILKKYDPILHAKVPKNQLYVVKRGQRSVWISQYEYKLRCYDNCPPLVEEPESADDLKVLFQQVAGAIGRAQTDWKALLQGETDYLDQHLFLSNSQKHRLHSALDEQQNTLNRYQIELDELADAYRKERQEYPFERP